MHDRERPGQRQARVGVLAIHGGGSRVYVGKVVRDIIAFGMMELAVLHPGPGHHREGCEADRWGLEALTATAAGRSDRRSWGDCFVGHGNACHKSTEEGEARQHMACVATTRSGTRSSRSFHDHDKRRVCHFRGPQRTRKFVSRDRGAALRHSERRNNPDDAGVLSQPVGHTGSDDCRARWGPTRTWSASATHDAPWSALRRGNGRWSS